MDMAVAETFVVVLPRVRSFTGAKLQLCAFADHLRQAAGERIPLMRGNLNNRLRQPDY